MSNINQNLNTESSVFGLSLFNDNIFLNATSNASNGIYYSKIFQKNTTDIWNTVSWSSNTLPLSPTTRIEVRLRTGNQLPINQSTGQPYTLSALNSIIQNNNANVVDTIFERAMLNRSVLSNLNVYNVPSGTLITGTPDMVDSLMPNYPNLGTSYNSFRINQSDDTIWNYWSLPITYSPSYIPQNQRDAYLQARIWLQSDDNVTLPEMFNINFTSILTTSFTNSLV